jgi:aminopeptidase N
MKILKHACILMACCAPLIAMAAAELPFTFDAAYGRLPKNIVPLSYDIALVPDTKALTLTGTESVRLRFRSASATIELNSLNVQLRDVRLDGQPVKNVVSNDEQQLTTVVDRSMETAHFKLAEKTALVAAADAYIQASNAQQR